MDIYDLVWSLIFIAIRAVVNTIQPFWWQFKRINEGVERMQISGSVRQNDLVVQSFYLVASQHKYRRPKLPAGIRNLVLWHEDFYPVYRILKPHIIAVIQSDDFVYFAEFENYDVLDTRQYPIMHLALESQGIRYFRIHKTALIQISKAITIPERKVAWIFHLGRCGSTALAQAFNTQPDWKVLASYPALRNSYPAKPSSLKDVIDYFENELADTMIAMIKFQLRTMPESVNLCFKLYSQGMTIFMLPIIAKEFPDHTIIFMNRAIGKVLDSYNRQAHSLFKASPSMIQMIRANEIIDWVNGVWLECINKFWDLENLTFYHLFYSHAITMLYVLREQCSEVSLMFVDHDHHLKNLQSHLKQIFEFAGASLDNIELAVESYEKNSQIALTGESLSTILNRPAAKRDSRVIEQCNQLGKELGFPEFNEVLKKSDLNLKKAKYIIAS